MFVSRSFNSIKRLLIRRYSTIQSIDLSIDQEGIALIAMKREPVNCLNLKLLQELSSVLDDVKKNQCKGLVLTSATRVFSAGLDLDELKNPDPDRLRIFWNTIQDLFFKLYGTCETTSAVAINGYSAAGGCILSLLCDYRVMVIDDKAKIGLNDSVVGVVPQPWVCSLMGKTIGYRQAEIALTASTMYSAEEALQVNLIDETASSKDDAIEKCKQFIRLYDNIPNRIRAQIKRNLREYTIRLVEKNREEDIRQFVEGIMNPFVQEQIRAYMQIIKSKVKTNSTK